ncbi:MAG: hypothetical protein KY396_00090 [Actinobacteria bacterium]|nr:hypothetical protein [Actinomycetota bacterium]
MATYPVIEHRVGRAGRWLRENRVRLALAIAVVETLLVVAGQLRWFWVVAFAAVALAAWWIARRHARSALVRQGTSTLALSQAIPLLAPLVIAALLALLATAVAVAVLVVLVVGVIAVAALVRRRR